MILLRIKEINNTLQDLKIINDSFLNGDIIYHELLEDYYIIDKERVDGSLVIKVKVRRGFTGGIKKVADNLRMELRDLNRELFNSKRLL